LVNPGPQVGQRPGFNRPGPGAEQGGRGTDVTRPGATAGQGGREPGAERPGQPAQQAGRGPGFNRPDGSARGADRPGQQAQPGFSAPPASSASDARALAERERALENSTLPRSQMPRNDRPQPQGREGGGIPAQNGFTPNEAPRGADRSQTFQTAPQPLQQQERPPNVDRPTERSDRSFNNFRPPAAEQPNRVEQARPPVDTYSRPQVENRQIEERRFSPPPSAPSHVTAPPPAPVPRPAPPPPPPSAPSHVTAPPPAPVPHAAPPPPQSAPPANREQPQRGVHGREGRPDPPR
jgi:hypothetical protein